MSYPQISDVALVVEAIRRNRSRKLPLDAGGFQGTRHEEVAKALVPHLLSSQAITEAIKELIKQDAILLEGRIYEHQPQRHLDRLSTNHRPVLDFHPEILLDSSWHMFSIHGTPLQKKWCRKGVGEGRLLYPKDSDHYLHFSLRQCYVIEDGLPKSAELLRKRKPLPLPRLPAD